MPLVRVQRYAPSVVYLGGGAWGTGTNWTPNGVPGNSDTATISQNITANAVITTGNLAAFPSTLTVSDTNGTHYWDIGVAGNTAALGGPLTINTPIRGTSLYEVFTYHAFSGAYPITKTGPGIWGVNGGTSFGTTTGIVVEDGGLLGGWNVYTAASGKYVEFGSAAVTPTGTILYDTGSSAPQTVTFPIKFVRSTTIRNTAGTSAATTFSGPIDISSGVTFTTTITNGTTLSGAITGTAGFTKSGAGSLTVSGNSTAGFSGTVTLTGGSLTLNAPSGIWGAGVTVNLAAAGNEFLVFGNATSGSTLVSFQDAGGASSSPLIVYGTSNSSGVSFGDGQLVGLTGTAPPSPATSAVRPKSGLGLYADPNPANANGNATVTELPTTLTSWIGLGTGTATTRLFFTGKAAGNSYPGTTWYLSQTGLATVASNHEIYANQSVGGALTIGAISRVSGTANSNVHTVFLRGSNTLDNTVAGIISNAVGTVAITKADASRWILSGANTYTGATSISAGTLSAQNATAFGGSGAVTQTGGTIEVTGGTALNKAGAALTLISAAGANALSSPTGANSIACAGVTLSSTAIVDVASGASLTLNNTAAMSGATFGITKNNSGELDLGSFSNTYTGAVTINAGTLTVKNLNNSGTPSSLGTGAGTPAIALSGTLKYTGLITSGTNRSITFTGSAPALDASGTGVSATANYTACTTTNVTAGGTITFTGSSTNANTLSASIGNGAGTLNVAKAGAGKWVLSGATLNYTGTTTVSAGTLNFGSTNRSLTSAIAISSGTIENSTNTLATSGGITMTGGTITAEITSTTAVTVNSGITARLEPTNSDNSYTGATAINAGAVLEVVTDVDPEAPAAGKVLGNSAVTVAGTLTTSANANQRGQMRYGGNLTFNSGAILRIGFAA